MAERSSLTPAEIAIFAGGTVAMLGSFFDFTGPFSAWDSGLFPVAALIPVYCATVAADVAIGRWGGVDLPDEVGLGFTWRQLHLVLSSLAFVMAVAWLIATERAEIGLYAVVLGSAVCAVGSYVRLRESALPAPSGPARGALSPAGITLLAGAAAVFLGSFLDFESADFVAPDIPGIFTRSFNAWDGNLFFPVSTLPVFFAVVIGAHFALTKFARIDLPTIILRMTWDNIYIALGVQSAVMMVAFLVREKGSFSVAIGFWLMLSGSIALAVGAVLSHREVTARAQ